MSSGRFMGLDPGERRVGVALSDAGGIIATPHQVIDRNGDTAGRIAAIIAEYDVDRIVVGLPVSLSGDEGPSAEAARRFGMEIAVALQRTVEYADERFSSVTAERALLGAGLSREERRGARDKVAAAVMLQAYLDRCNRP